MKEFFRSKSFKILLATICIVVGVSLITFQYSDNFINSIWGALTSPIQKFTTGVSDSAGKLFETEKTAQTYESEISALQNEIQKLREQLVNYTELENENKKYEKYLEIKKSNESLKFSPATVVARDTNDNFYGFMINQGSSSGISVNDPVITQKGLIGRVVSVNLTSAKVATILSPDCCVGAADRETQDSGVITGNVTLADQNLTRLSYVPAQTTMKTDGLVVTTGLGGIYPRNLIVGRVCELKNDEFDSSRYAIIEPFEDIRVVRDVLVVTSFQGKGNIETKSIKDLLPKDTTSTETSENNETSNTTTVATSDLKVTRKKREG